MFTGIIQGTGRVADLKKLDGSASITIDVPNIKAEDLSLGASIAINGVCLTVVQHENTRIRVDVSPETLSRTILDHLRVGSHVNTELPMRPQSFFGGHVVQGHVDGVGQILHIEKYDDFWNIRLLYPRDLRPYLVEKGSICIDGISLTINKLIEPESFEIMLIPHTWKHTIAETYAPGQLVNLEVDILAKYVERMMQVRELEAQA